MGKNFVTVEFNTMLCISVRGNLQVRKPVFSLTRNVLQLEQAFCIVLFLLQVSPNICFFWFHGYLMSFSRNCSIAHIFILFVVCCTYVLWTDFHANDVTAVRGL